ncbi:zinc ribbon domain-containing protein YjdM [Oceanobacillus bengalensis]|uniref:Alkylphosphonate utilization protein n=1 Tax=Oceanobacillus bengalensis TaxID=1435466 RepID=A0A494Z4C7_9BACI|nr:zinc ribbon domain-containing protein YjdM [Oceanobacillus bengalensis]RKQ17163.1 alkylphosphonate utilization protein [Oceanobacillus bengalensis]
MNKLPDCPKCNSEYTYEDGTLFICPECGNEWSSESNGENDTVFRDINGNILENGDSVTVTKDLKVKGSSSAIKKGTKVKNIRLLEEPVNDHDIEAKVPGIGSLYLKTNLVKKL